MAIRLKSFWIVTLLFFPAADAVQAATMYKWVDENGTVQYTQIPPTKGQLEKTIESKPSPVPAEPKSDTAAEPQTDKTGEKETDPALIPPGLQAGKAEEEETDPSLLPPGLQADKVDNGNNLENENCAKARKNLEILLRNHQVTLPDGKKIALSEEMRQQKIDEARQELKDNCGY